MLNHPDNGREADSCSSRALPRRARQQGDIFGALALSQQALIKEYSPRQGDLHAIHQGPWVMLFVAGTMHVVAENRMADIFCKDGMVYVAGLPRWLRHGLRNLLPRGRANAVRKILYGGWLFRKIFPTRLGTS